MKWNFDNKFSSELRNNNKESVRVFMKTCSESIYRIYYHVLPTTNLAIELSQECLLKILQNITKCPKSQELKIWVFQIAFHQLFTLYKHPQYREKKNYLKHVDMENLSMLLAIKKLISTMEESKALALLLSDLEEFSDDDAAQIMQMEKFVYVKLLESARLNFMNLAEECGLVNTSLTILRKMA